MACYARYWMTASEYIFDLRSLQAALKLIGMLAVAHSVKMWKQVHLLSFDWWLKQWHSIQTQNLESDLDSSVNKATLVSPIRKEMFARNFWSTNAANIWYRLQLPSLFLSDLKLCNVSMKHNDRLPFPYLKTQLFVDHCLRFWVLAVSCRISIKWKMRT